MSGDSYDAVVRSLAADQALWGDFLAFCDCGGRQAGTPGEAQALELARARLAAVNDRARLEPVPYAGWRCAEATLALENEIPLACNPRLGAQSTAIGGMTAEVLDLGRGTHDQFVRHAHTIAGRCVLVRHEY